MIEKSKKETMSEIFKRNKAVISMDTKDGFANISFEDNGEITVKFLNEYGYQNDDMEINMEDVQRVGKFMQDLKEVRLSDYKK
jgi:hypothetical protein